MRGGHGHGHGMRSPLDDDDHPFVSKCVLPAGPATCKRGGRAVGAPADEPPALLLAQLQFPVCTAQKHYLLCRHLTSSVPACTACFRRYQTLEEVAGKVAEVAQDQNGCRFLQKKFDEGGPAAISMVFAVRF